MARPCGPRPLVDRARHIFVVAIIASKPTVTYLFGFWR